jgi:allantoin racemase
VVAQVHERAMSSPMFCARAATQQRILVINPNSNPLVSQRVRLASAAFQTPELTLEVVNPSDGPLSIENDVQRAEAEGHVLRLVRERLDRRYDAYVLACFDDIALEAVGKLVSVPVIGTCEAGISAARATSPRFAVVTTVHSAIPGIHELLRRYGAGNDCVVRAAGVGVAAAASAQADTLERIAATVEAALREDGAQAILLASGGLTGYADSISARFGVPVLDGVACAIALAVQSLRDAA